MKRPLYIFFIILLAHPAFSQSLHTSHKNLPCIDKTFQVYAHVILDSLMVANYSLEDLNNALAITNAAYEPICARFELCGVDTIRNYEYDSVATDFEVGEMLNKFQVKNRINIYLVSELQDPGTCGFAVVNGISNLSNSHIFLKCQGGTLVHEMGHLFGLLHTFEGNGVENVNGSNCETEGDNICDTPADPFIEDTDMSLWVNEHCEFIFEGLDANGEYYSPDVGNIMSYYPCTCGFTWQQYKIMADNYLNSNPRMW